MNFQPADIIRFAALVGGFLLCALGALLMWLGVGADGAVNIKSAILSGSIQTGSAGLFTLFFGFGIIIFVLGSLNAKSLNTALSYSQRKSKVTHIAQAFWVVLAAFLGSVILGSLGYGAGFGGASLFLGFLLAFIGAAYMVQLQSEWCWPKNILYEQSPPATPLSPVESLWEAVSNGGTTLLYLQPIEPLRGWYGLRCTNAMLALLTTPFGGILKGYHHHDPHYRCTE